MAPPGFHPALFKLNLTIAGECPLSSRSPIFWWLLCLLWAAKIFWLSTDTFSGNLTRPLLASLLESLHIHLEPAAFRVLHTIVRKSAHLVEFSVFTFFLYRALSNGERLVWRPRIARWSLLIAAAGALADEFHQIFSRNRGPSFIDSTIDVAGAAMAILVIRLVAHYRSNCHLTSPAGTPDSPLQILEDA
jgi:VanZ family protein